MMISISLVTEKAASHIQLLEMMKRIVGERLAGRAYLGINKVEEHAHGVADMEAPRQACAIR